MQSGSLGIQATDGAISTNTSQQKPAIMGGSRKGGAANAQHTHNTTSHTEEARRGARRQQRTERERTHTHQKGYERALAGSKKGPRIIR